MKRECCDTCRFWHEVELEGVQNEAPIGGPFYGLCRRRAPVIHDGKTFMTNEGRYPMAIWPITAFHECCGEYQEWIDEP